MAKLQPKKKKDLLQLIAREIDMHGPSCTLNHIDVSKIKNMNRLFYKSQFNGDIAQCNTSRVTDMGCMFQDSHFNGDISRWNTSSVKEMFGMFYHSQFNGDISQWDTSNVTDMFGMFQGSQFSGDLSAWKKSNEDLRRMFGDSYDNYMEKRRLIKERVQLVKKFTNETCKKQRKTL